MTSSEPMRKRKYAEVLKAASEAATGVEWWISSTDEDTAVVAPDGDHLAELDWNVDGDEESNAELIVLLRNAAPEIVAALEWLAELTCGVCVHERSHCITHGGRLPCPVGDGRAALDALDARVQV